MSHSSTQDDSTVYVGWGRIMPTQWDSQVGGIIWVRRKGTHCHWRCRIMSACEVLFFTSRRPHTVRARDMWSTRQADRGSNVQLHCAAVAIYRHYYRHVWRHIDDAIDTEAQVTHGCEGVACVSWVWYHYHACRGAVCACVTLQTQRMSATHVQTCMGNADDSPVFYTRAQVSINSTTYTVHVGEVLTTLRTDAVDVFLYCNVQHPPAFPLITTALTTSQMASESTLINHSSSFVEFVEICRLSFFLVQKWRAKFQLRHTSSQSSVCTYVIVRYHLVECIDRSSYLIVDRTQCQGEMGLPVVKSNVILRYTILPYKK